MAFYNTNIKTFQDKNGDPLYNTKAALCSLLSKELCQHYYPKTLPSHPEYKFLTQEMITDISIYAVQKRDTSLITYINRFYFAKHINSNFYAETNYKGTIIEHSIGFTNFVGSAARHALTQLPNFNLDLTKFSSKSANMLSKREEMSEDFGSSYINSEGDTKPVKIVEIQQVNQ